MCCAETVEGVLGPESLECWGRQGAMYSLNSPKSRFFAAICSKSPKLSSILFTQ